MGLIAEARNIQKKDPAAKSLVEVMLLYPGFHVLVFHRCSHWLYKHKRFFLARMISQWGRGFTGIEIHPGATIGPCLFIDHGMGIVIGETAEIGTNCTIYHQVTLGGTGKDTGKRHPTLEDHVMVGSGAKILGPFTIGSHSKIAANAVVLEAIPPHSTAVGVPARIVRQNGQKVEDDLDQVHIPDPIAQEFARLNAKIKELEKKLEEK